MIDRYFDCVLFSCLHVCTRKPAARQSSCSHSHTTYIRTKVGGQPPQRQQADRQTDRRNTQKQCTTRTRTQTHTRQDNHEVSNQHCQRVWHPAAGRTRPEVGGPRTLHCTFSSFPGTSPRPRENSWALGFVPSSDAVVCQQTSQLTAEPHQRRNKVKEVSCAFMHSFTKQKNNVHKKNQTGEVID